MITITAATTTKLSDTQSTILSAASQRADRAVILPERLTGGAADKVITALAAKGLVEPVTATPGMPVWRESSDGLSVALRITNAELQAIGIEPEAAGEGAVPAAEPSEPAETDAVSPEATTPRPRRPRTGTKQELLIGMLRRPEGATVPEGPKPPDGLPTPSGAPWPARSRSGSGWRSPPRRSRAAGGCTASRAEAGRDQPVCFPHLNRRRRHSLRLTRAPRSTLFWR